MVIFEKNFKDFSKLTEEFYKFDVVLDLLKLYNYSNQIMNSYEDYVLWAIRVINFNIRSKSNKYKDEDSSYGLYLGGNYFTLRIPNEASSFGIGIRKNVKSDGSITYTARYIYYNDRNPINEQVNFDKLISSGWVKVKKKYYK